jgi:hypothetical protein
MGDHPQARASAEIRPLRRIRAVDDDDRLVEVRLVEATRERPGDGSPGAKGRNNHADRGRAHRISHVARGGAVRLC